MLSEKQLDDLEWAREFLNRYEKKHRLNFRTEEPLKGYRQWCLDELIERAKRNGVI